MARKPVSFGSQNHKKAVREFTDRETYRSSFWRKYEQVREEQKQGLEACTLHVLNYYGFGGIGKTRLTEQLRKEMDEKLPNSLHVYYDLSKKQESSQVLLELHQELIRKASFTFYRFEYAFYLYTKKTTGTANSPQVQTLVDQHPSLKILLFTLGLIPGGGTLTTALSTADEGIARIRELINKDWANFSCMETMEPEDLYKHLPQYFAADMRDNMRKRTDPVVIFLDTYEALVNELSQIGDPLKNDEWLREDDGVIPGIPGVLWVISGREKLKWVDWDESLEQHLLGSLSKPDAIQFMEKCGISDTKLCEGLYQLTDGIPVYLDLCVDCYQGLLKNGEKPEISRFGKNKRELVKRFVSYASDAQQDNIYMLACLHTWTHDLVQDLAGEILFNFSPTTYEKTLELSFVTTSEDGSYQIHPVVGEVLAESCPELIRTSAGKALLNHFLPVLQSKDNLPQDLATAFVYVVRGAILCYSNQDALCDFYENSIKPSLIDFLDAGHFRQAKPTVELLEAVVKTNQEHPLYTHISHLRCYFATREGNYAIAQTFAEEWRKWSTLRFGEDHPDTIKATHFLAVILSYLGRGQESLALKRVVLEKSCKVLGEKDPNTIRAMNNLANTLHGLGQYQEALELQKTALEKSTDTFGENHPDTINTMSHLANILRTLNRDQEALELQKTILEKNSNILGENHPNTIGAMNDLATTLLGLDRHQEALEFYESVLEKRRSILGEDHPHTINTKNGLASTLYALKRHQEALELYESVLEKRRNILGENHPNTLSTMNGLANALYAMKRHQEALELYEVVWEKRRSVLGEDHPHTLNTMHHLANTLYAMNRYQEALELYETVLEKRRSVLGEEHSNTINVMYCIANTLNVLERYREALELYEVVWENQCRTLGEDHPKTIKVMELMSDVWGNLG